MSAPAPVLWAASAIDLAREPGHNRIWLARSRIPMWSPAAIQRLHPLEVRLNDQEIIQHAERIASGWPARPANAPRARRACPILSLEPDGPGALRLRLGLDDPAHRASLRVPGQYTTLQIGALEPRFSVIAQAPDLPHPYWELLITRDSTMGRALEQLAIGDTLGVSDAEGPGFAVERIGAGPILIFVTGSGIATARPVLQHIERADPAALHRCAVYYGERRWDAFAYGDDLARWIGAGCSVWRVSELEESGEPGALRYIQHAFVRDAHARADLTQATALLAGAQPMLRAVSAELMMRGMPPERILTNF
jgi:NAD(P)H-flavin reductase